MEFREHVALAPFTTLGVGGPARWFAEAATEAEAIEAVRFGKEHRLPLFLLGGGSNLLVSDAGFAGLVLRVALGGVEIASDGDSRIFTAGAGESWDALVEAAVQQECAGIECLAGIPGTVGGTPVQNVGAYGQEVAETIVCVRVLDLVTLQTFEMSSGECHFAYRSSIFNSTAQGRYLVLRVEYRLRRAGKPNLRYADLQRAFALGSVPTLEEVSAQVRQIRRSKGMLLVEGDPDCRSAGSFFKNPMISAARLDALQSSLGLVIPSYPAGERVVKLPAAWLIEQAGLGKGFVLGRAGISSRHTLALINRGDATASEILALRDRVVDGVQAKFGIDLQMEPVMLGF